MIIKLSNNNGFLEVVGKDKAERLINQAINEIECKGSSSNQLLINKRCIADGNYLLEVGILKEKSFNTPSSEGVIKVQRDDKLLKAIDKLQLLIK